MNNFVSIPAWKMILEKAQMSKKKNKDVQDTSGGNGNNEKTLILVRHAKSDWNDPSLSDFERPLNGRGKRDAPIMAYRLLDKKIKIDAILSSPAKRARKTASIFAHELKLDKDIIVLSELYGADADVFYNVIQQVEDKYQNIALFSHNPGITDFANLLTGTSTDNIPTCGIFAISAATSNWSSFRNAEKKFLFFDFPKAEL